MVYNAMKLFMEVNPTLFDECSNEYTDQQNNAEAVKASRQAKWDRLAQLAESMKQQNGHSAPTSRPLGSSFGSKGGSKVVTPLREDDEDPISQESQQRMERLRLQDDREKRTKDYERHSNPVR